MTITAQDVLKSLTGRTNINNDNNNNNNNDIITSIIVPIGSNEEVNTTSSSLLASPSSQALVPEALVPSCAPPSRIGRLPPTWKSVKIDLFQNGTNKDGRELLTLKLGIIPKGETKPVSLTAQLNSPIRHIYRKVDKEDLLTNPHWIKVKEYDKTNRQSIKGLRGSKFYINMKSGSIEEMVVFLYKYENYWCMELIKCGEIFEFLIDEEGSSQFRKSNGIATAFYGEKNTGIKWISQKELGI